MKQEKTDDRLKKLDRILKKPYSRTQAPLWLPRGYDLVPTYQGEMAEAFTVYHRGPEGDIFIYTFDMYPVHPNYAEYTSLHKKSRFFEVLSRMRHKNAKITAEAELGNIRDLVLNFVIDPTSYGFYDPRVLEGNITQGGEYAMLATICLFKELLEGDMDPSLYRELTQNPRQISMSEALLNRGLRIE